MMDFSQMSDDELIAIQNEHSTALTLVGDELRRRHELVRLHILQESRPYADEAWHFLTNEGFRFQREQVHLNDPTLMLYKLILPGGHGMLVKSADVTEEQDALLQLTIDELGNLREWHERRAA